MSGDAGVLYTSMVMTPTALPCPALPCRTALPAYCRTTALPDPLPALGVKPTLPTPAQPHCRVNKKLPACERSRRNFSSPFMIKRYTIPCGESGGPPGTGQPSHLPTSPDTGRRAVWVDQLSEL